METSQIPLLHARPVPRMQTLPLPYDQVSIQRDGVELTRYHFAPTLRRPFLFPILGPSGRSLTRMGHPHAPVSHSHHNSVWVAHHDVNGDSFWSDSGPGRILHSWIVEYTDGDEEAGLVAVSEWVGAEDRVHLIERRGIRAVHLPDAEWLLILDFQLEAGQTAVTFGKTPFGMVAVRMAKSIGTNDGGGLIRNSEGNQGETGPDGCFWKRARWVDYSGPIAPGIHEGIALLDHPANPDHPAAFHVRGDGWMGSSLTLEEPLVLPPGALLKLRYGLYIHRGVPAAAGIEAQWEPFSTTALPDLPDSRH